MSSLAGDVRADPSREVQESALGRLLRWANRPAAVIVVVGVLAGVPRFWDLGYPPGFVFDEVYYAKTACIYLDHSNERCNVDSDDERYWRRDKNDTGAWVHPALGKWMIAGGEAIFGTDSFGWRFAPAVFGTATVMLLALIAHLLFRSPIWTFVAGLLAATESLMVVHSRIAMLDGLVAFWIVLAFALALLDKRWIERRTSSAPAPPSAQGGEAPVDEQPQPDAARTPVRVPSPLFRPWRIATGIALGAAVATKWSGLTAVVGVIALTMWWEVRRRRTAGLPRVRAMWRAVVFEGFPIVLFLVLLPAVVYAASYVGWFLHFGWDVGSWVRLQEAMWEYHRTLEWTNDKGEPIHPYLSEAWRWIFLARPVLYFARYAPEGEDWRRVIYANGNPAIFWGSLVAMPYLVYAWWRRRDWRPGFIGLAIAAVYLPWLVIARPQFLFYAVPIAPFLVVACVYLIRDLSDLRVAGSRSHPYRPVAIAFVFVSVGLFVWFWPALTASQELTGAEWSLRAWFPAWV